jgi:fructose-specific phosphotransferase system component IIB
MLISFGRRPNRILDLQEFVPLANFDLVVYTQERGPIVLSLKTSIRERYKQAEFEAQAMKDVHRRAKNFLVTMEKEEALSLQSKIDTGVLAGIDEAIVANDKSFDRLIEFLKNLTIVDSPIFSAIKNPKKIDLIG